MVLLFTLLFNALEAVYESLYDKGKKSPSAIFEFVLKVGVVATCLYYYSGWHFLWYKIIPLWQVFLGFILIRFAIFDLIWNLTRGMKWNYYGTVKLYDRIMAKFGGFGWFVKIICGIVGVCFLLGIE